VRGAAAWARGDADRAVTELRAASSSYAAVDMEMHAACAQRAAGALLGGRAGGGLCAEADEVLIAEGVADPVAWTRAYTGIG
jgi:hypothetical protein